MRFIQCAMLSNPEPVQTEQAVPKWGGFFVACFYSDTSLISLLFTG